MKDHRTAIIGGLATLLIGWLLTSLVESISAIRAETWMLVDRVSALEVRVEKIEKRSERTQDQ